MGEVGVTSTESDPVPQVRSAQAERCSRTPLYVLGAILVFLLVGTYFDFSDDGVENFIKQTGGQLCFAYSSIGVYRAIFLIEDAVVAVGTLVVWLMIRARYCLLSRLAFIFVLGLMAARLVWMSDCAP
jgi:hypothetical protein